MTETWAERVARLGSEPRKGFFAQLVDDIVWAVKTCLGR